MNNFLRTFEGKTFLQKEYVDDEKTPTEIAAGLKISPKAVRAALKFHKFHIRDKGEAQKIAIKKGKRYNPTLGRERTPAECEKMSMAVAEAWQRKTKQERKAHSERCKKQWEEMSDEDREHLQKNASVARRKALEEGSILEKYLLIGLKVAGYDVLFHHEFLLQNERMHLDLYLPNNMVAIEVDGPSHYFPIWGEERLYKTMQADNEKNGLLLSKGISIIRVKYLAKNVSEAYKRDILAKVLAALKKGLKKELIYVE